MRRIRMVALSAATLVCLEGAAQAFTHHPSTPAERAQTKVLNEEQLQLAKKENEGLAINTNSTATDASAGMAANAPPAAAPTRPVPQAHADTTMTAPSGSSSTSGR